MNWDADFAGLPPVKLPDRRKLEALSDCQPTRQFKLGHRRAKTGQATETSAVHILDRNLVPGVRPAPGFILFV
jgi:hypothetical protein